jgi:hypothetical protein
MHSYTTSELAKDQEQFWEVFCLPFTFLRIDIGAQNRVDLCRVALALALEEVGYVAVTNTNLSRIFALDNVTHKCYFLGASWNTITHSGTQIHK